MGPQATESWQPQTRKGKEGLSTTVLDLDFRLPTSRTMRIIHASLSTPLFGVICYSSRRNLTPTPSFLACAFAQSLSQLGRTTQIGTDPSNPHHRTHCHLPTLCGACDPLGQVCLQSFLYPQRW